MKKKEAVLKKRLLLASFAAFLALILAKVYLDLNENFDEAISLARKGLELEPEAESAPLGHYVLADIYNRLRSYTRKE